jgi:hypothetical protein
MPQKPPTQFPNRGRRAGEARKFGPKQRAFLGLREIARIKRGNDALVRVCMIGFAVAIAAIAPVTWGWKFPLFLVVMILVGIIMPAIRRARVNPY